METVDSALRSVSTLAIQSFKVFNNISMRKREIKLSSKAQAQLVIDWDDNGGTRMIGVTPRRGPKNGGIRSWTAEIIRSGLRHRSANFIACLHVALIESSTSSKICLNR